MERVFQPAEQFRIGRVVSRMFHVLFANWPAFLPLAALLSIPSTLLRVYASMNPALSGLGTAVLRPGGLFLFWRYETVALAVYFLFGYTLQAALAQGTILHLNGERPGFGQCLSVGLRNFVPVFVIGVASYLAMIVGFLLLVVPGFILLLMWSVVIPVRIVERTGIMESLGRSRALTRGFRGKILLLGLMYLVFAVVIVLATRPLTGLSLLASEFARWNIPYVIIASILISWGQRIAFSLALGVGTASVYYELRLVQEGIGADQMAAAFD